MSEPAVLYEVQDRVAVITMNRPAALNSFVNEVVDGVLSELCHAEQDTSVRVAVITGAGRAFSAGGNLDNLLSLDSAESRRKFIARVDSVVTFIRSMTKPVIAMVNGVAAGAGVNLALSCDLAYAAAGVKFIQSFANIAVVPDCGGFYYLTKVVGFAKAKEMMFLAEPVMSEEMARLNLLNAVYPREELSERVMEIAHKLADKAPLATAMMKKAINDYGASIEQSLDNEALAMGILLGTHDFHEGVAAFREKRKPVFTGK